MHLLCIQTTPEKWAGTRVVEIVRESSGTDESSNPAVAMTSTRKAIMTCLGNRRAREGAADLALVVRVANRDRTGPDTGDTDDGRDGDNSDGDDQADDLAP